MPVKKYKVEIVDDPEIGRVVGFIIKEVRKKNEDAAKRKNVLVDMDSAKLIPGAAGAPSNWTLKLRRPANDPGTAGDKRVVANTVHLIIYDRYEKIIDRITRRFRVPPTP